MTDHQVACPHCGKSLREYMRQLSADYMRVFQTRNKAGRNRFSELSPEEKSQRMSELVKARWDNAKKKAEKVSG